MNICSIVLILILSLFNGPANYAANGKASFYADRMHGHRTASGERYDKTQLTAAHATLPFHTRVLVTNLKNGKSVVVKINDRMARSRHHVIDLSKAAAQELAMVRDGTVAVRLEEVTEEPAQQDAPAAVSGADANAKL
ncbi:septal ring lytic transglycosylase RlpA family protein [Pontibacter actiniarum]|uniref:Probable endolytic peptidoglycan transglycosylase RlpA n=1 Tax=Pontibacter actiniarum TaxID=323450 RepID=A0A1X9YR21_9BACT|nr:septal ring lytic transglycosylase RlpA family protein [Pontibacter actiniarum]ARS35294.1 septal ring lytic transglycosylase RlpA family lipoprotein [Pontibacter actiniarum]